MTYSSNLPSTTSSNEIWISIETGMFTNLTWGAGGISLRSGFGIVHKPYNLIEVIRMIYFLKEVRNNAFRSPTARSFFSGGHTWESSHSSKQSKQNALGVRWHWGQAIDLLITRLELQWSTRCFYANRRQFNLEEFLSRLRVNRYFNLLNTFFNYKRSRRSWNSSRSRNKNVKTKKKKTTNLIICFRQYLCEWLQSGQAASIGI